MQKQKKFIMYRRKREGRTNYKKRLKLLISGSPRLVIRRTNKNIIVQVVNYSDKGDAVVVTANSSELKKYGWNHATGNLPAAYLTGLLIAKKALSKKADKAIVDLGLQTPSAGSRMYAAVKGAVDGGMTIPCSEEVFPKEDRLKGAHIDAYRKSDLVKDFDAVKAKLMK
jgi:large subunit ribosomal protein L18